MNVCLEVGGYLPGISTLVALGRSLYCAVKYGQLKQAEKRDRTALKCKQLSQEQFKELQYEQQQQTKQLRKHAIKAGFEALFIVKVVALVIASILFRLNFGPHKSSNKPQPINGSSATAAGEKGGTKPLIDHQKLAHDDLKNMTAEQLDSNWRLDDYFGHVRVINLAQDSDKLKAVSRHLEAIGLKPNQWERFDAIFGDDPAQVPVEMWQRIKSEWSLDPKDPDIEAKRAKLHRRQTGCYLSHYRVIKEAKERHDKACSNLAIAKQQLDDANSRSSSSDVAAAKKCLEDAESEVKRYSSVLILEDDNRFGRVTSSSVKKKEKNKSTLRGVGKKFREVIAELPQDYDLFFFTAQDMWNPQFSSFKLNKWDPRLALGEKVKRVNWVYDLNAYGVNSRFYNKLLDHLKKIEQPATTVEPVDNEIASLMQGANVYLATPPLAFQGGYQSQIEGKFKPYDQRQSWRWNLLGLHSLFSKALH